jgi:DUF4097 and DUF4098 domain-containing protein YvlB
MKLTKWKIIGALFAAGFVLALTGLAFGAKTGLYIDKTGARLESNTVKTEKIPVDAFSSVKAEMKSADIEIVKGNENFAQITYSVGNTPEYYLEIEDGTLTVKQSEENERWMNFGIGGKKDAVKIYIPEQVYSIDVRSSYGEITINDAETENLSVNSGNGNIKFGNITAVNCAVESKYGNINMRNIKCVSFEFAQSNGNLTADDITAETGTVKNNHGNIIMKNLKTNGFTGSNSSGNVYLQGDLTGKTDISGSYGDITVKTAGKGSVYCDLSANYGTVRLNGKNRGAFAESGTASAENSIQIKNSSGDINVEVME